MALPIPIGPVVVPAFTEDRGNVRVDPITKSTSQVPSGYLAEDVCGNSAYKRLGASVSINQLTEDCQRVLQASGSLNITLPSDGTATDIDALAAYLVAQVKIALADVNG